MTIIAHETARVTLYTAERNDWSIEIGTRGRRMHVGASSDGSIVRFYSDITLVPAERRVFVTLYDDAPVERIGKLIRLANTLAARDGEWKGPWARGLQRNGHEWVSKKLGDPIDVANEFAALTARIDLDREVTL